MLQEDFYDSIERPWKYDAHVGVLIAAPYPGEGDGAFRYTLHTETGHLLVEANPCPTNEAVFQERRDAILERVMVRVRASLAEDAANAANAPPSPMEEEEGPEGQGEEGPEGEAPLKKPRTSAPTPPRQRRVTNDLLATCIITTHVRPTTGRTDLTVVTPDGCIFRSKAAALRYLGE